jgi:hypothetical protein
MLHSTYAINYPYLKTKKRIWVNIIKQVAMDNGYPEDMIKRLIDHTYYQEKNRNYQI